MTKESWNQYQNQYRKNNYKQLSAYLEPDLVNDFKKKLKEDNISFTTFLRNAINLYLNKIDIS